MSITRTQLVSSLAGQIPAEILDKLIDEYQHIKRQFALEKFGPSELNGGRFGECVLRVMQHLNGDAVTPFGTTLPNTNGIIGRTESNTALPEGVRIFVPKLIRVLLDVRNRRDVAHVGGDVSPNLSDSLLVVHVSDWIMTELVRSYYKCSIGEAKAIVININELSLPVIAEVDGFIRVQDSSLGAREQVLVILYHKMPIKVSDADLQKWIKYSNTTRFRKGILGELDSEVLIHYEDGYCTLLPKGVAYVDRRIPLDLRL